MPHNFGDFITARGALDVLYPQLSTPIAGAIDSLLNGERPDSNLFNTRPVVYYHRQMFINNGTLQQGPFTFFNTNNTDYVTNWFGPNGAPTDYGIIATGFGIKIQQGVTATGALENASSDLIIGTNNAALTIPLNLRQWITENGLVSLKIGDRTIIDRVFGLDNFPPGIGVEGFGGNATTLANTLVGATRLNNGAAMQGNFFKFPEPVLVLPNKPILGTIAYQVPYNGTATAMTLWLQPQLYCVVVTPANY